PKRPRPKKRRSGKPPSGKLRSARRPKKRRPRKKRPSARLQSAKRPSAVRKKRPRALPGAPFAFESAGKTAKSLAEKVEAGCHFLRGLVPEGRSPAVDAGEVRGRSRLRRSMQSRHHQNPARSSRRGFCCLRFGAASFFGVPGIRRKKTAAACLFASRRSRAILTTGRRAERMMI